MSYAQLKTQLRKKYTDLSKLIIDPHRQLPILPSGILSLDRALQRGGIFGGLITELFGRSEVGKTTLAGHFAANCQKLWHKDVLFLDFERTLDTSYWAALGVDIRDPDEIAVALGLDPRTTSQPWDQSHPENYLPGLIILEPATIEEGLENAIKFMLNGPIGLVVVDTIAGMTPEQEMGDGVKADVSMRADEIADNAGRDKVATVTKTSIGALSREMSAALKHMTKLLVDKQIPFLAINQIRTKIGFITTETTPGGNALHHYSNTRIELRRAGLIKPRGSSGGEVSFGETVEAKAVGAEIVATIVKNKRGVPFATAKLKLSFGEGFDVAMDIYDVLTNGGLADRAERTYTFAHEDFILRFDSLDSLRELLRTSVDPLDLQRRIRLKMGAADDIRPGALTAPTPASPQSGGELAPRRRRSRTPREGGAPPAPQQ